MPLAALPLLAAGLLAMKGLPPNFLARLAELGIARSPRLLVVRVADQTLTLFENGAPKGAWSVSTAANGLGEQISSHRTPRGLHRIREKIGAGLPKGAIFDSREFTGDIWSPAIRPPTAAVASGKAVEALPVEPDLITSRILWLEGLEPGKNAGVNAAGTIVDSHARFIYIHGTNSERLIGKPVSRGCIRMLNEEVIALFDRVESGDLVWIEEPKARGGR